MVMVATRTEDATRVCKVCGIDKPIDEFGLIQRWHLRVCKQCRYIQLKEYHNQHKNIYLKNRREYYREHRDVILGQMKEYHQEHWEEYYEKHRDVRIRRSREYYAEQKPKNLELYGIVSTPSQLQKVKERAAQIRVKNIVLCGYAYPLEEREKHKLYYLKLRTNALAYYGGKCGCCGESRYEMLTFDHKIRTYYKNKARGVALVYAVIKEYEASGYPNDKYRVLCWNCNTSRGYYG